VLPPAGFPLHLIALASERAINSQVPEDHRRPSRVTARVHPAVATSRGLADGDRARLVSPRGALPVTLECRDDVRPDSVLVAKGDWAKYDRGLNVLTEPRCTAGTGTAYNQNYVRLEPA
jgi:anaerobic selenocysteine-containing dehydrogenase